MPIENTQSNRAHAHSGRPAALASLATQRTAARQVGSGHVGSAVGPAWFSQTRHSDVAATSAVTVQNGDTVLDLGCCNGQISGAGKARCRRARRRHQPGDGRPIAFRRTGPRAVIPFRRGAGYRRARFAAGQRRPDRVKLRAPSPARHRQGQAVAVRTAGFGQVGSSRSPT
jgi:hypothetical protein